MKIFKFLYWKTMIAYFSFKWIFKINIGDDVIYKNEVYFVNNAINKFDLVNAKNSVIACRSEIKKVKSLKNLIRSFKSGWNFYNDYWFEIWMRNGIEDWMKKCNIW